MTEQTRWGILSTGNIAGQFARGLEAVPDARLVAVGSRTQEAADAFGAEFNVPKRHASYEALAADPEVDIIYVATPHNYHRENALLCLEVGKAVLCEKPFTVNAREAEDVVRFARERGLLIMDAMWTRFFPIMFRLRELLAQGVIGEPRMLHADFGFRTNFDPKSRLFAPELAGGALLDVGVYPITLSSMVLGTPTEVTGLSRNGETGVDEDTAMILKHANGSLALLSCNTRTDTQHEVIINGTEGRIRVHRHWWKPQTMTVSVNGKPDQVIDLPPTGNGYNYEAIEMGELLRQGKTESAIMPLDETLNIMRTMDKLRAIFGVSYEADTASA